MPRKRKVDLTKIQNLKDGGMSVGDIAKELDVSPGAISKGFKKLGLSGSQDVVLRVAGQINDSKLDAMAKLKNISEIVESELRGIREYLKGVKGEKRLPWQEMQLKHVAEVRKQLSLLREISETLYRIEEIEAFKKIILECLGGESPELRDRVMQRIKARRNQGNLNMGGND